VRVTNHNVPKGEGRTRLLFQEPKTSLSRRTIPIPEECLAALKQHKARQAKEKLLLGQAYQDHGLVFCQADGKPIDPRNFLRSFDRMIERAGLPPIRFHDARHTFATLRLELGESPKTVQTMLGRVDELLDDNPHGNEMDQSQKGLAQFLIPRGNASKLLEIVEEPFYLLTEFVEVFIIV